MTEVGFPATDDDERWKLEADDLRHRGLAAIREAAGRWLQTIALLLGIFSVVAFVKGPESLAKLDDGVAYALTVLVLAAAASAAAATWLAALASQGSPELVGVLTGPKLRDLVTNSYQRVARQLWWSRLLTVVAALLVATGMGLAWFSSIAGSDRKTIDVLIVDGNGAVVCGPVEQGTVSPAQRSAFAGAVLVQVVENCP
ncbi:hypothetical protein [Micromonospora parva]|uniref:hypothetical protein n=1 Tax=Micromonospora parva TaxID=1464048 RepID=UPI0033C8A9A3